MNTLERILERPEIRAKPPVLVDIGASGQLPEIWKRIAPYCICIAFDADEREFGARVSAKHPFHTLHLHRNIVSDKKDPELDFYLTSSPYCSSSLPPDNAKLSAWIFADLFDVQSRVKLPANTLGAILSEHQLSYVDWYKTDSQGTDLRLFLSLGSSIVERVLTASFEPGIIDAYQGEDKLHALIAKMDQLPFWMHDIEVRGTQRLSRKLWEEKVRPLTGGSIPIGLKTSPGWAEVSYLNTLLPTERFDRRDYLLTWVFSSLHEQHGFALEVATRGVERFGDAIFRELAQESLDRTVGVLDRLLPRTAKKVIFYVRAKTARFRR